MEHVEVLMSTFNGQDYLEEQINSVINQRGVNTHITARDDASHDETIKLLKAYENQGDLTWYSGENKGPALSFFDVIMNAPASDYYALCDQDDVWLEDKLVKAVAELRKYDKKIPVLYGGRPIFVNSNLEPINDGSNSSVPHIENYATGLIIRNMPGCTFVFNRALLDEVKYTNPIFLEMHDTWITQVCLAKNGVVIFDEKVPILYRQHTHNVAGGVNISKKKWQTRWRRVINSSGGPKSRTAREILETFGNDLEADKIEILKKVANYNKNFYSRIDLAFDKRFITDSEKMNRNFKMSVLMGIF